MKKLFSVLIFVVLLGCAGPANDHGMDIEAHEQMTVPPIKLSQFILGPGDSMSVNVWRHPDLNSDVEVQANGMISFPLIGPMEVSGMGLSEFHGLLTQRLSDYLVEPQVTIQVKIPKSQKVYVLGEVLNPGVYLLDMPMTAEEAIGLAGGFSHNAKRSKALLMRKEREGLSKPIVLNLAMKRNKAGHSVYLQRGDILYVPLSNVALVDRFFGHLSTAVGTIVGIEQGVVGYPPARNIIKNDEEDGGNVSPVIVITP